MYFEDKEKEYVEAGKRYEKFVTDDFHKLCKDHDLVLEEAGRREVRYEKAIAYLAKNEHYFRNEILRELTLTYNGVADKKRLVRSMYSRLQKGVLYEFLNTTWYVDELKEFDETNWKAYRFADKYSREIVNWLGRNVCIDLFDLVVTKQTYKRLKKFVKVAETYETTGAAVLEIWPKQWN